MAYGTLSECTSQVDGIPGTPAPSAVLAWPVSWLMREHSQAVHPGPGFRARAGAG